MDFQAVGWGVWTGLIWLKIGTDEEICGNETLGSIKYGEYFFALTEGLLAFREGLCSVEWYVRKLTDSC